MADVNTVLFNVKLNLFKRWHQKCARKRIQHEFEERIDKSVPRGSLFGITLKSRDAKTVTFETDLSVHTSHSCQILIVFTFSVCR